MTYKLFHFLRFKTIAVALIVILFGCGPEVDFSNLKTAPIEDYHVGLPLVNGKINFLDFLKEDQKENIKTDEEGHIYFEFTDDIEVANVEDIVEAFGGTNSNNFFKVNFDYSLPTEVLFPQEGISFEFTEDPSNCVSGNCLTISNEIGNVSKLEFDKGNLEVLFKGTAGGYITLTLSGSGLNGDETITNTTYVSSPNTLETATLPLEGVWINNEKSPTLKIQYFNSNQQAASAYYKEIDFSDDNEIARLEIFFKDGKSVDPVTIPEEQIELNYLKDIFDNGTKVVFGETQISFSFENPIGATGHIDLTDQLKAVMKDNSTLPVYFSSSLDNTEKTQILNVERAIDFTTPYVVEEYVYESDDILSEQPKHVSLTGLIQYYVAPGEKVQFSREDLITTHVYGKVPLYVGFNQYVHRSKTNAELDFGIEVLELHKAILRSEMNNEIAVSGNLSLLVYTESDVFPEAVIRIDGNDDQTSILPATTDNEGKNASITKNYLETSLTIEQVSALLKSSSIEVVFEMTADADPSTDTLEPVEIKENQSLELISGLYINASIDTPNSSN
ncbi:hypothetical protein MY04_4984 [Flammeovirga sp. MY04]|uniref:hypothetical protein n=1 Tax=Flammeovirga sp. MY04 TaxID=1191459 RepID=UPI000806225E|nr:hypothetical protein [Flammeovirga sp. MY04]ANQ52319.1 hypothetical protein MY04_4984 [Flammeovirga sp. MY04]